MFTFPHTTTAFLLKNPIDMRYGMFRLQGVIGAMLQRPMPKDSFYFSINRSHTLLKGRTFAYYGLDNPDADVLRTRNKLVHEGEIISMHAKSEMDIWALLTDDAADLLLRMLNDTGAFHRHVGNYIKLPSS